MNKTKPERGLINHQEDLNPVKSSQPQTHKRFMITIPDELTYIGLAKELSKRHQITPKYALQVLALEYCFHEEARVLIDRVLENRYSKEDYQRIKDRIPEPDVIDLPGLVPIPENVELSKTEERQVKYLTRKFHETKERLCLMDGSESEYPEVKEQLLYLFDSRMEIILGV